MNKNKLALALSVFIGVVVVAAEVGILLGACFAMCQSQDTIAVQGSPLVVVIDAGHGGRDNGVSSPSGLHEADVNLEISMLLKRELEDRGVLVALTRDDEESLADGDESNKKRADMKRRHDVIERAAPDLVISVHVNSFPAQKSVQGIQTFYHGDVGKTHAQHIQNHLNQTDLCEKKRVAMKGDFFILETEYPSVLVECGFLSNSGDEAKLRDPEYLASLAVHLAEAIVGSVKNSPRVEREINWQEKSFVYLDKSC